MTDEITVATPAQDNTEPGQLESTGPDSGVYQTDAAAPAKTEEPLGDTVPKAEAKTELMGYQEFKVPDGMLVDKEMLNRFAPLAKELGLNQAAAQKLIDLYSAQMGGLQSRQQAAVQEARKEWVGKAMNDPEYGGARLEANLKQANQALKQVATDEFMGLLEQTGLGDHPEVIRVFYRLSKMIGEDSLVTGSPRAAGIQPKEMYEKSPGLN